MRSSPRAPNLFTATTPQLQACDLESEPGPTTSEPRFAPGTELLYKHAALLAGLCWLVACGPSVRPESGGGDGGGGGGAGGAGEGGVGGADTLSPPELASAALEGAAVRTALGSALVAISGEVDNAAVTDESLVQELIEDAIATSMVASAACVAFDWSGLTATITFTDCTLQRTGVRVDGNLTCTVRPRASEVLALDFTALTHGASTIDGSVTVMVGVTLPSLRANLTLHAGTETILVDSNGKPNYNGLGGSLTTSTPDAHFRFRGDSRVSWPQGDRCPSAGRLTLEQEAGSHVLPSPSVVTFLPTTPSEGAVMIDGASGTLAFCGARGD